ncbi:hypothetical protein VTK73DRAFT_468 [Phialemonium thermophilum]|uniref:Uncharacterized protein n=1 Tax=Phialemonium thermophilum TaxID=223376 RepID=A0ABR3VV11_9PEZI
MDGSQRRCCGKVSAFFALGPVASIQCRLSIRPQEVLIVTGTERAPNIDTGSPLCNSPQNGHQLRSDVR